MVKNSFRAIGFVKKLIFETNLYGRKAFFINSNYLLMKKVLFFVAVMLLSISTASVAQFKIGGGVTAGSKISIDDDFSEKMGFGINVRGEFSLMDKLALTPGFTYFFPSSPDGFDLSMWQLNADVHYTLVGAGTPVSVYALGGLNYTSVKSEFNMGDAFGDAFGDLGDAFDVTIEGANSDETDSELGINLGAGVSFSKFYGEVKYDTAFEQVAISVGILF
jgi:opacity protein-like surface antigen